MVNFWERAAHSVDHMFSLYYVYWLFWLLPIYCYFRTNGILNEDKWVFHNNAICKKHVSKRFCKEIKAVPLHKITSRPKLSLTIVISFHADLHFITKLGSIYLGSLLKHAISLYFTSDV